MATSKKPASTAPKVDPKSPSQEKAASAELPAMKKAPPRKKK